VKPARVILWCLLLAAVGGGLSLAAIVSRRSPPRPPLPDPRVAFAARPFALQDVRLLDGPFREAMQRDQRYLLALDPDRLLHNFRVTAGLPSAARPLGGWEAPDVELRGHSVGHYLSALALMYASTGDDRFKARADLIVSELARVQAAMPSRGYHDGYVSAFPEALIDRVDARQKVWAPYYTLHKIMAGLLDTYQLCGNKQALDVVLKQADWVKFRMDRLTREQQQAMLMTEHGGMTEVLASLYAITGNADHLRVAQTFDHDFVLGPLARRVDSLDGLHANTQIPKLIGAAREYEMTGDPRYRDAAAFFWERVALHRSYANGGHSDDESFFPPEEFSRHLGASSAETCNTYNMLKLTRHLFSWAPAARLMDFYERALYNHILASQDPATGMMIYYCPLAPGAFRTYSTPDASFWCCVGTGMENHGKYADTIYFHGEEERSPGTRTLWVNLYIASELTWREQGLRIRQETRYPDQDNATLTFTADKPAGLAVKLRWPAWAVDGFKVAVNGHDQAVEGRPGSYVTVAREWKTGDTMTVRMPMRLRTEPMPDDPNLLAVLYGPVLLAADLGREGLDDSRRYGPSAPQVNRVPPVTVPVLVSDADRLLAAVGPVRNQSLTFHTNGVGQPRDVTLIPFARAAAARYNVYWRRYSPAEWSRKKGEIEAADKRRRELASAALDAVDPGSDASERDHDLQQAGSTQPFFQGRRGREARNGWFSYTLKAAPDKAVTLVCSYRGSEGRTRVFDVLVDGQRIAAENLPYHPAELLDYEYKIPPALTAGKTGIVVKFLASPDAATAAVFDVRIVPTR
jgi:uncharacterized protein